MTSIAWRGPDRLALGTDDGGIQLWDPRSNGMGPVASQSAAHSSPLTHAAGAVQRLIDGPQSSGTMISAGDDHCVAFWGGNDLEPAAPQYCGHGGAVRAVDWCGKVVATGDWAGNVHLSVIGEA